MCSCLSVWVSFGVCVYAERAHWILSTAVKCLCYEVIIAHDLHTHILRYSPIMYLKNQRIKCKNPLWFACHADVVWFSRFLADIRFTHHDDNMNRIIIFVSFSFISLFTARATKKRKPNWIENTYSINAFFPISRLSVQCFTLCNISRHLVFVVWMPNGSKMKIHFLDDFFSRTILTAIKMCSS